jgi:transmembrane sensor
MRLGDGSVVTALTHGAQFVADEVGPTAVTVRLTSGSARFAVAKNPDRVFRVVANGISVVALGTEFAVEISDRGASVEVIDGRVRIAWGEGSEDLGAGQRAAYPPAPAPVPASPAPGVDARASTKPPVAPPPARVASMADLLDKADDARLQGRPRDAVPLLRRALSLYADDPSAPLAAFTLGRVLLDDVGDPGQAAEAFARARVLAPEGLLAEDALAREVEAWSRAGDPELAAVRARAYVARYPQGQRLRAVRRFGGLE